MEFEGLCRSLGRSPRDVELAVEDLVSVGWLERHDTPLGDVLSFDAPAWSAEDERSLEPYLALLHSASRSGKGCAQPESET